MFNVIRPSDKVNGDKFKRNNDVPRNPIRRPSYHHSSRQRSYADDNEHGTDTTKNKTSNNTANYRFIKMIF